VGTGWGWVQCSRGRAEMRFSFCHRAWTFNTKHDVVNLRNEVLERLHDPGAFCLLIVGETTSNHDDRRQDYTQIQLHDKQRTYHINQSINQSIIYCLIEQAASHDFE